MTMSVHGCASEADVRAALERVLASDSFRGAPQLAAFLRFVVDAALCGRGARLKGYTIGVEALGRDARFNPQVDPIVRVEATRLRRALERYYAGAGIDDPVVIDLPRGNYAPIFLRRCAPSTTPNRPAAAMSARWSSARWSSARWSSARTPRALVASVTVLALVGAIALLASSLPRHRGGAVEAAASSTRNVAAPQVARALPPGNGMPTIAIDPFRAVGEPGVVAGSALTEKLRDAFARFDTINVASGARRDAAPAGAWPYADYRLVGALDHGESTTTIRFQLIDSAEGTIVWSGSFPYPAGSADQSAAEEQIVGALTDVLLQSYGVIRSRDRARQLASPTGDPRYRCVLAAADSFRLLDPAAHDRARACLESLTVEDPSFTVGFEYLAIVYYREYALGYPSRAGEAPALDRALRAAHHAIELAPASARAYQMLFVVQYARHDLAAAFAAGDKAMALNRYDLLTVAEYGGRLIMTGEVGRGMAMLRRTGEAGSVRPSWHEFYLFLGCYVLGDAKEAAFHAEQIIADRYPLGLLAQAIAASDAGNQAQAQQALDRLLELQPAWRTDARRLLEVTIYKPEIVDLLLRGLARAGLQVAS